MSDRPFNTEEPLAYFVTWTCYGTWLPGDERGWHQWGKGGARPPCEPLQKFAKSQMKEPEFLLTVDNRQVVEATVEEHCKIRNWLLHEVSARSNHVHVIATASGYPPETVRDQLKAWCTRKLKASYPKREHFWTEGASCRYINHEADLESAIAYVREAQDRKGLEDQY
ncbi:Transposase IS200 like protein [Rosistilla ulvae]|uniref:Transposase IS200 like protein n=2 Tax=Rosistilla ulvae TaxID=1930277 RepID=A0A517LZK1_9BACT|nr:Transposase IS200 like protein [Rosistilla ulvae]